MIGSDLQDLGRVRQAVDFVEHNPTPRQAVEEPLRVLHDPTDARKLTVKVFDVRKALTQARLPDPSDPCEPDNRTLPPRVLEEIQPETARYHMQAYLHIMSLNASMFAL